MGETTPIHFGINTYQSRSRLASSEDLMNLYVEPTPVDSFFKSVLYPTPGLKTWLNLDQWNPVYGMEIMKNNLYVVCGLNVYKIDVGKNKTLLGTMATSPGRVIMTENGQQMTILTESGIMYYTDGITFGQITDPDVFLSISTTTLDSFTVNAKLESNEFQYSGSNDTTDYSALKNEFVTGASDNIVRTFADHRELWHFKQRTIEVWYNSANPSFTFERINGVFIEKGCAGKYTIASDEVGLFWVGNDRVVYTAKGYTPVRISTYPIEAELESWANISDAFAFIYTQEGHKFYCLTSPSENKSICFDITTELWHKRSSRNPNNLQDIRWRPNCFAFFDDLNLVGDYETGIIYELDLDTPTEDGTKIIRYGTSSTQFANFSRVNVDRLVIMMDTGIGKTSGEGSNPQLAMQYSIDGGNILSDELLQPIGELGKYETEVFWTGFGQCRTFIVKLIFSEPIARFAITGVYLNYTIGYS